MHQLARLNELLRAIVPQNSFYAQKFAAVLGSDRLASAAGPLHSLAELALLPPTFKDELQILAPGLLAANLTWPLDHYTRLHQTSGTLAARWSYSIRPTIGSGGWSAGSTCWTPPRSKPAIEC